MGDNLNEFVQDKLKNSGTISGTDVAQFSAGQPADTSSGVDAAIEEDTEASLTDTKDPVIAQAKKDTLGHTTKKVVVSADDKDAFIKALVNNTRFTRAYSCVGGAVRLVLRTKTIDESNALVAAFTKDIRSGNYATSVEQTTRLRSLLMVFQVAELNGVQYTPPEAPLVTCVSDAGTQQPAWLERVAQFDTLSDGLHSVIWGCIADFEDRYWTMVEQANNSDFWQPGESI